MVEAYLTDYLSTCPSVYLSICGLLGVTLTCMCAGYVYICMYTCRYDMYICGYSRWNTHVKIPPRVTSPLRLPHTERLSYSKGPT